MRADPTLFERHARDWWNERSPAFRSLHAVNEFRVALLASWLGARISGATVVDLGSGGGLLAEPMARAGAARVIGVELGKASVVAARAHANGTGVLAYVRADLQSVPLRSGCADVVLLADVLEHVPSWRAAVAEASRLLRPKGLLYVNTLNRTWRARLLAVTLAEGIGLVPRGTHDARMFIKPDELVEAAGDAGLGLLRLQGERPRLVRTLLARAIHLAPSRGTSVIYSALFERR